MTKKIVTKVMVAVAAILVMASCSKDDNDKATELTPQQKAEAVVQKLRGANREVVTKEITTDLDAQGQSSEGAVREDDVKVTYSIETTTQDGSPLVTIYVGASHINARDVNGMETFVKFVPKVTPVGTDRVKVSSKEIKKVAEFTLGNSYKEVEGKTNQLVDASDFTKEYTEVTFEYNAKTNTINNLAITTILKGMGITVSQKMEYKNLVLKASQKVVPFGESQYEDRLPDEFPNSTARVSSNSTLSGVKSIYINMNPGDHFLAKIAYKQFKPYGYHYAKFTPASDGSIQMELCNAYGVTNGGNPDVNNQTGFASDDMPMRLYFLNVKIRNNNGVITDAQSGHNYLKAMKRKNHKGGFPGWLFRVINPNGQESKNAEVLTSRLGQHPDYDIAVKTNLPLPFTAEIKID